MLGQTATFTVTAGGTTPLTYQWQENGKTVGTNSTSYMKAATASADNNTKVLVIVSNSVGSITSATATLTVTSAPVAPTIATEPTDQTVAQGQTATFFVVAAGTAPLTYQWQQNGTDVGSNSASYTTPPTKLTDNHAQILVKVSNAIGSKTSTIVTLRVIPPPAGAASVLTHHNDNQRISQNLSETTLTPNGSEGAIWMAGAGLAADRSSNIYFLDANGTFDHTLNVSGFPNQGDYGNGFIKLSTAGSTLTVADYFNMHDTNSESNGDVDLGSGGAIVLPDLQDDMGNTWHLAVGAG
jgi:hypothetical protein